MSQRLKSGKRLCSLFLSLCLLCSLFVAVPVEAAETLTSGDWEYEILEDGTVEITGYNGEETEVVIPGMIDGKSVTSIGKYAFGACISSSITIPNSVTSIGDGAFVYCSSLMSITIPSSVTGIGNRAFYYCSSLMSIDVAENSQSYASKDGILYDKSCETLICCPEGKQGNITIPSSVTHIETYAFAYCSRLTSIAIPSSVTSIGPCAFEWCSSLMGIDAAENSQSYASKDGILYDKSYETLICCPKGKQGNITIPSSVMRIESSAFDWCDSLKSIEIPSSVTSIGGCAFNGCSNLTSITIPSSVTSIGKRAFYYCSSDLTIYGEAGSYAEEYAKEEGIKFVCLHHTPVTDSAIAATCTEAGKTEGSHCIVCGEVIQEQEVVPATGHTEVIDSAIAATCTEAGKTEGSHCIVCEEVIQEQEIVPARHTVVPDPAQAPTCTEEGKTEGSHCSVCGEVIQVQEVIPASHTVVSDPAIAATCTKDGKTEGSHCSVCGEVMQAQEVIEATGHTLVSNPAVVPTCTEIGKTEGNHCTVCGEVLQAQEDIPATGHTAVPDQAQAPTCTKTGKTEGSHCSVCGEVIQAQEVVPATGHTVVPDPAIAATCTEAGKTEGSHCTVCGEVIQEQEAISATGHTVVPDPAQAPTCTENGKTKGSHCGVCGEIIQEQKIVPVTGHTYQPATQKATTKKNGTIKEKCSVCGYVDKTKTTTIYAASKIKLLKTSFTYNGKNKKPTVILKDSKGKPLSKDSYKITYPKNSKNVGEYTVIVTLQGNYSGTVKLTYQIKPKSTSITELDARKKGFIIEWKKQTKQTTGYQIQYSTSKKFKGAKTVTIKKNKTVSKSIGKLKADEKYYVRVRTYKTVKVNGKSVKLYSEWSKAGTTIPTIGKVYRASVRSLYQTDNRSKIRYGGDKTTTVASSGCGGVSIAMALNALKNQKTYTGKNVMQWMADHGYYYGYGTMQSGLYAYAANQGLKVKYADTSDTLISELKKGAVAIAIVKDKTGHEYFANATSSGHYILISGFKVQRGVEQVYVNNPMKTKTSGWFDLQKLENNVKTEREGYANSYVIISQ